MTNARWGFYTNTGIGILLDFRKNALDDMRDRKIQSAEVIYTVEHYEVQRKNKTGRLIIYEAHPEGRLIIVSVDAYNPRWVVSVKDYRWEGGL